MKRLLLVFFVIISLFFTTSCAEKTATIIKVGQLDIQDKIENSKIKACAPILINSIQIVDLVVSFNRLKRCADSGGKPVAHVNGNGGVVNFALMFYDLMRTSGVYKKTTFYAYGIVPSATNIIWLSANKRVVLPSSSFLFHKASIEASHKNEDARTRKTAKEVIFNSNYRVALESTESEEIAKMWADIMVGNIEGKVIGAEEALSIGWATDILEYK